MKTKTLIWILAVCVVFIIGISIISKHKPLNNKPEVMTNHNQIAGPAFLRTDAENLKNTIVTPHLEQQIISGKNVLWCSTFQLVWNELYDINHGPVTLSPPSAAAEILNKRFSSKDDLDDASYVAMGGFLEDGIVEQIRKELDRKFNGQECPDILNEVEAQNRFKTGFIGYGYLFKNLPFKWAFERQKYGLIFLGNNVENFSNRDEKSDSQVSVLDVVNKDNFIIELKTKQTDDRLILAKIPSGSTLRDTVLSVEKRIGKTNPRQMEESQSLRIPVLNFDIYKNYNELMDHIVISRVDRLNNLPVLLAAQSIRFRLDERGTVIKSEAAEAVPALAGMPGTPQPVNFIFDKPFLILLQRKDSKVPYFAMWVGNTELLIKSKTNN